MRIEALMTAVDAAGYVMVAEDDLPEAFGNENSSNTFEAVPSTALTVWQPVLAAADRRTPMHLHATNAWSWVMGRFASGAAA